LQEPRERLPEQPHSARLLVLEAWAARPQPAARQAFPELVMLPERRASNDRRASGAFQEACLDALAVVGRP